MKPWEETWGGRYDEVWLEPECLTIADVRHRNDGAYDARAKLMGAAPDLYRALEAFVNAPESEHLTAEWHQAVAALKKARGET